MKIVNCKLQIAKLRGFLFLVLCFFVAFPPCLQAELRIPEKFDYYIYWLGIKAGSASFAVDDTPEGLTITTRANSNEFISIFYKVRNVVKSILYPDGYPSKYILKTREGRHRKDKVTFFGIKPDNESQKVVYNNKLKKRIQEFNLEERVFDPLSAFYEIRKRKLVVGRSEYITVFDSKKLWDVEVQVLKKERVITPAGEFNTIKIRPLMKSEGIFKKKGEIYIWLTDEDKKIPVMIKSKIKIGSLVVKLVQRKD